MFSRSSFVCRRFVTRTRSFVQWTLSQAAVRVDPDLVKITPYYEPSEVAVWFQVSYTVHRLATKRSCFSLDFFCEQSARSLCLRRIKGGNRVH